MYGVSTDCARPTARPPNIVAQSELQPADQRRRERRDDEERQGRVVERGEQVGEDEPCGAAGEPGAEPGRGLDAAHRHAERGGDLAVVRERPHRGAELRHAEEDADGGRDHEREPDRDDLRQADARLEDLVAVLRARQRQEAREGAARPAPSTP